MAKKQNKGVCILAIDKVKKRYYFILYCLKDTEQFFDFLFDMKFEIASVNNEDWDYEEDKKNETENAKVCLIESIEEFENFKLLVS